MKFQFRSRSMGWTFFTLLTCFFLSSQVQAQSTLLSLNGNQFTTKTTGAAVGTDWILWSNGYVESSLRFPSTGIYQFQVQAYGDVAASVSPLMEVRIDQKLVKRFSVRAKPAQTFNVSTNVTAGTHKIEIAFTNDYYANGQDRNLYVKHLNVLTTDPTPTPTPTPAPAPAPTPTPAPAMTEVLTLASPSISSQAGQTFTLTTRFNAVPMSKNHIVFVHFVNSGGTNSPFAGDYSPTVPTTTWSGLVNYNRSITLPANTAAGTYIIKVGLYENVAPYLNRATLKAGPGVSVDGELRYTVGTLTVGSPAPTPTPTATPTPTPTPTPTVTPPPSTGTPSLKFYGRFDNSDPKGPKFTWSGSSIMAAFNGNSVSVTLNQSNDLNYFVAVIDNQPMKRFVTNVGTQTYTLATNLSAGDHQVLLFRDSEGNEGVSQFLGFNFGTNGKLLATPGVNSRYRLEFIGDSNTAGYGDLGVDPCPFSTATESAWASYAQQTALLLGAAPSTNISYSGIGVYRNWGHAGPEAGFPAMPGFYPRTLTDSTGTSGSFSSDPATQPNVVVINLGANDYWDGNAPPQAGFISAYKGLVQKVRSQYPNAYIIAATTDYAAAIGYVQTAVSQIQAAGETKIQYLKLPFQASSNVIGCNGHPSQQAQSGVASFLANHIKGLGL
jgi:lysophospholipase L1-like esterase